MKNLSLVLVALLLTAPAFAEVDAAVNEQPLTLASADISASTNLKVVAEEPAVSLEKDAKAASDALSAKVEARLAETIKEVVTSVKF